MWIPHVGCSEQVNHVCFSICAQRSLPQLAVASHLWAYGNIEISVHLPRVTNYFPHGSDFHFCLVCSDWFCLGLAEELSVSSPDVAAFIKGILQKPYRNSSPFYGKFALEKITLNSPLLGKESESESEQSMRFLSSYSPSQGRQMWKILVRQLLWSLSLKWNWWHCGVDAGYV